MGVTTGVGVTIRTTGTGVGFTTGFGVGFGVGAGGTTLLGIPTDTKLPQVNNIKNTLFSLFTSLNA